MLTPELKYKIAELLEAGKEDWCLFAETVLGVSLDPEQSEILRSVQFNKMITVASGTARGKDFVAAVAAICFLYTTPVFEDGKLIENTKIALTAPTDRQVRDIMMPEIARLHRRMIANGFGFLAGNLNAYAIRTEYEEWFLVGFKADEHNHEAWSGFHAANTMFVATEASGISDSIFSAIEGNLQGNSRMLIVFNPNIPTGYAAFSQKSKRWKKFRLDSLNAPNVLQKKIVIPGQVDFEWVNDKVETWCQRIPVEDFNEGEGDFIWEGFAYRPNDLFRVKIRGLFPKVSSDVLVPIEWVQIAQRRWLEMQTVERTDNAGNIGTGKKMILAKRPLRLGADVAGMGRDSSAFAFRYGPYVDKFEMIHSGGAANHMEVAGKINSTLSINTDVFNGLYPQAFIDTIGEGAGVYSRLVELKIKNVYSCKFSEAAKNSADVPLKDSTGQYEFLNMRAYLYWAIRDWLDPFSKSEAALPPDDELMQDLTETKWRFRSDGKIQIEEKEELKKRLKRSPDKGDALANTFWPVAEVDPRPKKKSNSWAGALP